MAFLSTFEDVLKVDTAARRNRLSIAVALSKGFLGSAQRNWARGEWGDLVASIHVETLAISLLQGFARDHPPGRDDVCGAC